MSKKAISTTIILMFVFIAVGFFALFFKYDSPQLSEEVFSSDPETPTEPNPSNYNIDETVSDSENPLTDCDDETIEEETPSYLIDNSKKYVGVYFENLNDVKQFDDSISILAWFDTFDTQSENKLTLCLDQHKYIAFITLEPENMSLSKIADGTYDDIIIEYLQALACGDRINTELFIRFAHEMEMRPSYKSGWYSWQGSDPDIYIAAFQRVVDLGHRYAPNVKWVWSPNRADSYTKAYYPGDEYVDYVSLSLNNTYSSAKYDDFEYFYVKNATRDALEAYNKPIIIGEMAKSCDDTTRTANYLISCMDYLESDDNIVGMVFLDKNINSSRNYKFSNNSTILQAFINRAKEIKEKYGEE